MAVPYKCVGGPFDKQLLSLSSDTTAFFSVPSFKNGQVGCYTRFKNPRVVKWVKK